MSQAPLPGPAGRSLYPWLFLAALAVALPAGWISAWTWTRDLRWLYLLLVSFLFSGTLVPLSIRLARLLGAMDLPGPRKVHALPTPRLGGLAIYGGVMLALARNFQWSRGLTALMAGASIIYLMGVWEDARGLSARARLAGQTLAAVVVMAGGVRVVFVPSMPGERLLECAITLVWFVGLTNAFNFLDGIDGLAAGLGALCGLLFMSLAWPERQGHLAYAASSLAGACLGFLPYNWRPARVFLGDSGATFIGFVLAGLAVLGSWASSNPLVALSTPLLVLGIPIFDMIYTTVARIRRGDVRTVLEWLEYAGRDHFHHRLLKLGLNASEAVCFILLVNLCLGLGAFVIRFTGWGLGSVLLLLQSCLLFTIIVVLMLLGREFTDA